MCIRDRTISTLKFSRKSKNRRNCSLNNSTAKAKPKMTVKNGVVYRDALSDQEKKRIVMQKKKDRKAKKAVSYTHLDVYKRQGLSIHSCDKPENWK